MLGAVIYFAIHYSEAKSFAKIVQNARPHWLALAFVIEAATYVSAALVYWCVVRAGGYSLGVGAALRLSLAKVFVDQALPSGGVSGTVVLANGLKSRKVPRPVAAASVVIELASYYAAYVLCLTIALGIAVLRGATNTLVIVVSFVFMLFAVGISTAAIRLSGHTSKRLPPRLNRFSPLRTGMDYIKHTEGDLAHSPRLLFEAGLFQLFIFVGDATVMWFLIRSLGADASFSGVFASYMISSLLRTVGIVPGGLGTFEAASIITLRMVGVPTAVALSATLLFRGLSFWLPMLPGIWFSRAEMASKHKPAPVGQPA